MIKKSFTYILCLIPWYLVNILPLNYKYYDEIIKPFFAPSNIFYVIAWNIIYILLAYSIYQIVTIYKLKEIPKSYKLTLFFNYLLNQSYIIVFFALKSPLLGMISSISILISTLLLYEETSLLKNKAKYLLVPYILLSLFGTILSISIYILN